MPNRHSHAPISYRPPEAIREWLTSCAGRSGRTLRGVVTEALEEYRARREHEEATGMQAMSTEAARECLRLTFT